jgi:hypothetical protein
VEGTNPLTDFQFSEIAAGVSLPEGEHLIEIIPTGAMDPAITGTVTLEPGMQYTLAAIGGANSWDLEIFPMVDDITPDPINAKVRITHLAPFATDLDDTRVDVCTDAGAAVLSNVPYKGFTDPYLSLPAGDYDLLIAVAGTSCATVALDLPSLPRDAVLHRDMNGACNICSRARYGSYGRVQAHTTMYLRPLGRSRAFETGHGRLSDRCLEISLRTPAL